MSEQQTLVMHQITLEKLFSKNQILPRIKQEFRDCPEFDFTEYMIEKGVPVPFGMDLLAQMALHKRATIPVLVGILNHHFKDLQLTADMLRKTAEVDLVDYSPDLRSFVVKFTVSAEVQEELDRYQFPLPMVVPPLEIKTNNQSGYYLNQGSVILRNNHTNDDVCLDHLNRMNQVKLTINHQVINMIANKWKNLDKCKPGETKEDFQKRKKAFEKYDRTAKEVMKTLQAHSDHFFLTHKYDKRGRTYCMGYHVSTQGAPWNKAAVELAEKELVSG